MPRYNRSTNPAAGNNPTGWQGFGASGTTTARLTGQTGLLRPTAFQVTNGNAVSSMFALSAPHQTGAAGALSGQTWTLCMQARCAANLTLQFYVSWLNTSNAQLSATAGPSLTPGAGVAVTAIVTGVAPSDAAGVCATVGISSAPANTVLVATAARLEQISDPNMTYGDGDTPLWTWDGTAGSSSSTRAADDGAEWWSMATLPF